MSNDSSAPRNKKKGLPKKVGYLLIGLGGAVVGKICTDMLAGIIGNRSDAWFMDQILPRFGKDITVSFNWLVGLSIGTLLLTWVISWIYREVIKSLRIEKQIIQETNKLLTDLRNLDDVFLSLLSLLDVISNTDQTLKKLIDAYVDTVLHIFDGTRSENSLDTCHVVIYRPDPVEPSRYLTAWHGFNAPLDDKDLRFPISPIATGVKRGIAGKTYLEGNPNLAYVVHVFKAGNGIWDADDGDYIFPENDVRRTPSHRAIAAIPLVDAATQDKLGVMCFLSMNPKAFDDKQLQEVLLPLFASRLSVAIQFENKLASLRNNIIT